jgi:signal transduction histidine kinase
MPTLPKSLNRHDAANLLAQVKEQILKDWEAQSRARVEAAKTQSRIALRDSMPQCLDQLVETLRASDPSTEVKANTEVANTHAEDRSQQAEYSIDEIIFEYHILRSVVIKSLESSGVLTRDSLSMIHEFIDRGISSAALRYVEIEVDRQKADKKAYEEARADAERATQAKTAFLANMSHEIRTPLGAIMGFVSLLRDSGLSQEEISSYLSVIERNSHHLLRIIDDILDLTKVEAGKMVIEKIEFPLIEFLAEFASLVALKAREKGIIFQLKATDALPEIVISDPTRLRQILSNVVGNAIKFTDKGRVDLAISYDEKYLEFRVTDTGKGVSQDQRLNLFQAFSQADPSTTRKFGGTGLGLVITKKLCQALDGDFALAESELGKGSVFIAGIHVGTPEKVKLVPIKPVVIPSANPNMNPQTINLKSLDLLLVEDSPDNQFLVQKMLGKTGAKVTIANNGSEGVKLALVRSFDVILMDIQMPVMDGHECTRTLRSEGYKGPIVALTAHAMKEERERAIESGFSHFLSKPIDQKSLFNLLANLQSPLTLRL